MTADPLANRKSAHRPLKGRNILITGAGDGVGRALALACAGQGAQMLLLGRTQSKLEAVHDLIVSAGDVAPVMIPGDLNTLTDEAAEQIGAALENQFGELHGLVHNAAILGARVPLAYYTTSDWQAVLQVNLTAAFLLTRALLPVLQASDAARVVFTSASDGLRGNAYWGAYAVSKFAIEGLAQVLRDELDTTSNISVHIVDPGPRRTALRAAAFRAEDPDDVPTVDSDLGLYLYLLSATGNADLPFRALARQWRNADAAWHT